MSSKKEDVQIETIADSLNSRSTKAEMLDAIRLLTDQVKQDANMKDNILETIRKLSNDHAAEICEEGIEEFCLELGLEYTAESKTAERVYVSVAFRCMEEVAMIQDCFSRSSDEWDEELSEEVESILLKNLDRSFGSIEVTVDDVTF